MFSASSLPLVNALLTTEAFSLLSPVSISCSKFSPRLATLAQRPLSEKIEITFIRLALPKALLVQLYLNTKRKLSAHWFIKLALSTKVIHCLIDESLSTKVS